VPDSYSFVADAPLELATGVTRSRIPVAMLGSFSDRRYGAFKITQTEVDNWKALLAGHFQGRIPIDTDHATDKGVSSEASGWITGLAQEGQQVWADVEWTPKGEAAVREKRYLYISPTFVADLKDDQGRSLGPALLRAAQTNSPFLHRMPAVTLSAHTVFAQRIGDAPDSRPAMSDLLKTLAKLHGLPEDADEAKVLEAVTAAKAKADAEPPNTDTRTLETMAQAEGMRLLTADEHRTLMAGAEQGVKASGELAAMRFATAFDNALHKGCVDAKPETRELHAAIYAGDAEQSLKLLQSLPEGVVNMTARGEGGDASETPEGVDPESVTLDREVKAYIAASGETDYAKALNAVLAGSEQAAF
jgi:hypothetical protein